MYHTIFRESKNFFELNECQVKTKKGTQTIFKKKLY